VKLENGDLTSDVEGLVAKDGEVLVIRSIQVSYSLRLGAEHHDTARRVHDLHADFCPVARTLKGCVRIETELGFRE
jgi:organic hydroperoxide reductase OsmC/OhrA